MLAAMDLRQLRNFVAVAEQGNISQAAKEIYLTQSALSRQIKALEDEVGHPLLERQAHSIRLTSTGEVLLREGRELLQYADQVLERVRLVMLCFPLKPVCVAVGHRADRTDDKLLAVFVAELRKAALAYA
jgi:molybdate transport repressor ModE-like protein